MASVEFEEVDDEGGMMCVSCRFEVSKTELEASRMYKGCRVGRLLTVAAVAGKEKLSVVEIDVGLEGDDSTIPVVTNAKYVSKGDLVVVATIGAVVPAGANPEQDVDSFVVKKSSVGGRASCGVLCDAPMLCWERGTKGLLVKLSTSSVVGAAPPAENPATHSTN
jgi:tRNA-binding EMAP/Myf-like protein